MSTLAPDSHATLFPVMTATSIARAVRLAAILACAILACMILAGAVYTLAQITGGSVPAYVASAATVLLIMLAIAGNFTKGA